MCSARSKAVAIIEYNPDSLQAISSERTDKAEELIKNNGGTFKGGYALLGSSDLLFIVEFPNIADAVKTSVDMGKMFGISFATTPAVTIEEFDKMF